MELWASGFNAWGQLDFSEGKGLDSRDLKTFKCVLRDKHIEVLRTSISATLVQTSHGLLTAGVPDELISHCLSEQDRFPSLAIAGNDQLAEFTPTTLMQYPSLQNFQTKSGNTIKLPEELRQIVANQTTFTTLSKEEGRVYTWGDGRYPNCLGREVSHKYPANIPSIVEDLAELPGGRIRKISSGGYVTAALTDDNDLYVWGGRAGQKAVLEGLEGTPMPIDLKGDDVWDVAVGMNHILAVTMDRKLFVVGDGGNGQLGSDVKEHENWEQVELPLEEGQRILSVHAGYKNSFVVVENGT
ncbi:regulator of chromosome condensation 1/beta-lactamase-inhibitor protein II [Rhexocercosporidium sp. MPI-PUGE-AT-0058]|nr:regulator of chromosome condensation 1/beta-lactamase-inhibitor protein II [Rhexocercosporidium sp. MPI-PUGE-AT-0058]